MRSGRSRVFQLIATALLFAVVPGCGEATGGDRGSGAGSPAVDRPGKGVRVAAASDLQFALKEVIAEFSGEHPGIPVTPTFGSSGNFFAQIQNGAPFDLYLSADISYPQRLEEAGQAEKGTLVEYGVGRIVVFARADSPIDVTSLGIDALNHPSVRKIAIADPTHAPYGKAAEAAMKSLGVYDQVKDKLVLGENISQTAQFVQSGSAEVGIIALSLALAPEAGGKYAEIPADAHPPLRQGGIIVASAQDPEAARAFRDFMISDRGVDILKRYGFTPPA